MPARRTRNGFIFICHIEVIPAVLGAANYEFESHKYIVFTVYSFSTSDNATSRA